MLHKQVYQPYVYTYPLPLVSPSLASHPIPLGHHRALSWAPYAIQLSILCISSVHMLSCVRLFETPRTATCQASLSIINSWSLLKLMFIKSVMSSNQRILYRPLHLLPSMFPSISLFQWIYPFIQLPLDRSLLDICICILIGSRILAWNWRPVVWSISWEQKQWLVQLYICSR